MKIQLAYKFTGEDTEKLTEELKIIKSILEERGHEIYIPVLDPERPDNKKELFLGTIDRIKDIDIFLVLMKSEAKSEGMLMEVGHAFGLGKKVILAINKDVKNTHLRELIDNIIEFENIDDLYNKLKEIDI